MTTHEITTGKWYLNNGTLFDTGYAGHGVGLNNPDAVGVKGVGPAPPGVYDAVEMIEHHPHLGWYVLRLEPDAETRAYIVSLGRDPDSFFCHGDEVEHLGEQLASDGCLIHSRTSRLEFWGGTDHQIRVIAGLPVSPQTSYPRSL